MNPLTFLNPYLFWIKLAGFVLALGAAAAGAGYVVHNRDQVAYDKLALADSKAQTASVTASLTQLQSFIDKMHTAGTDYQADLKTIQADFDALKKEFANATLKPLPVDCKPDAGRVRVLSDAIAAANKRAAAVK